MIIKIQPDKMSDRYHPPPPSSSYHFCFPFFFVFWGGWSIFFVFVFLTLIRTGNLIGFVTADIALDSFSEELNVAEISQYSEVFLVKREGERILSSDVAKDHDDIFQPIQSGFFDEITIVNSNNNNNDGSSSNTDAILDQFRKVIRYDDHVIATFPFPLPPEDLQGEYIPQYFVIHSIPNAKNMEEIKIEESIDRDVIRNTVTIIVLGIVGCIVVLGILWHVSSVLTQPLLWIQDVARRILRDPDNIEEQILLGVENVGPVAWKFKCAPKTEINQLVKDFQSVLSSLSGEGVSKVAVPTPAFAKNSLSYHEEFDEIIGNGTNENTVPEANDVSESKTGDTNSVDTSHLQQQNDKNSESFNIPSHRGQQRGAKLNSGPVINLLAMSSKPVTESHGLKNARKSSLFRWIVILIIVPFLLTNAILVVLVTRSITETIPEWVKYAEEGSREIAQQNLLLIASSKASVISSIVSRSIRDLHFMTRIAGWLLFEGIERSDGFTTSVSASEKCKTHPAIECPFNDPEEFPCSCDWKDAWEDVLGLSQCWNYNASDSRFLQTQFFAGQSVDADMITGDRNSSSSFPLLGNSPNTTEWWSDGSLFPGSIKGANATGYSTTYDRIRVSSAASAFYFPIYNYATSLGRQKPILGLYLSFENDGLFHGFSGCDKFHAKIAAYQSTKENRAAEIAPHLCPLGKYGYDPRCRGWYDVGKKKYKESMIPVHVTSPYSFAISKVVASSATSPIANPKNGGYAGQVLLDYFSLGLLQSMEALEQTFSFVITPDLTGDDTVIAPNKTEGWKSVAIGEVLFPNDDRLFEIKELRQTFDETILPEMKSGNSSIREVEMIGEGGSAEPFYLAFAPVTYRSLLPVDPSDYGAGVTASKDLIYSVAIGESISKIEAPFQVQKDSMDRDLLLPLGIYISVIVVVSCLYVVFIVIVSKSYLTCPFLFLRPLLFFLEKLTFELGVSIGCNACDKANNHFA